MKIHGRLDKDIKKQKYHPILWGGYDKKIDEIYFTRKKWKKILLLTSFCPLLLPFCIVFFASFAIFPAVIFPGDDIYLAWEILGLIFLLFFLIGLIFSFNQLICIPLIIKTCKWYESIKNLPEPAFERELDEKVRSTSWFWYYYVDTYKEWKKQNSPVMKKYMAEINEYCDTHKMKPEVESEYIIRRLNQLKQAKTITKEQYDLMGDELFLGAWDQFEKEKKLYR